MRSTSESGEPWLGGDQVPGLSHLPSQHRPNAYIVNNVTEKLTARTALGGSLGSRGETVQKKNTSKADGMLLADCFPGLNLDFQNQRKRF